MVKFEVGKPFPLHNRARGIEQPIADMNEKFFDICYYTSFPKEDEPVFRKGKLKYGTFIAQDIPFFIVELPDLNFDVSINIHKIKDEMVDGWLNSDANIINLYLINSKTNTLEAMRTFSIHKPEADRIRDACEQQDQRYSSAREVDAALNNVVQKYTTSDMIGRIKMFSL